MGDFTAPPAPLHLDNSVTAFGFHVQGSGATGDPSCGLKSFTFAAVPAPVTVSTGVTTATAFKQNALGYLFGDCDLHVLSGGQYAQAIVKGWFVWDNVALTSDQHGGVFFPPINPQFEFYSWDWSHTHLPWTGVFELDAVAFH